MPSPVNVPPHHPRRSLDIWRCACLLPAFIQLRQSHQDRVSWAARASGAHTHTVNLKPLLSTKSMQCMSEDWDVGHFNVTDKIQKIKVFDSALLTGAYWPHLLTYSYECISFSLDLSCSVSCFWNSCYINNNLLAHTSRCVEPDKRSCLSS